MNAEIISVGTELLTGQIVDTNARFLSERLHELGFRVLHRQTVGDNPARMRDAVALALSRSSLVITIGGLGPTEDDMTKFVVADCLGLGMERDKETVDALRAFAARRGADLPELSLRQADFPVGCTILRNERGTAPGYLASVGGRHVAVLPGPPRELTHMYEHQLEPRLRALLDVPMESRFLKVTGVGEPQAQQILLDLTRGENPTLAMYCGVGELTLRLTASGADASALLDALEADVRARLGGAVYAQGRDATLAAALVSQLRERGQSLSVAESCTGGMLCSMLVDVPGASDVFRQGFVTYANAAKQRALGVSEDTLRAHGAVSQQCAIEMALGARKAADADFALSVTGVAGPDGGSPEKPVGTVYIGLAGKSGASALRFDLGNRDRQWIRTLSCHNALNMLRLRLMEGVGDAGGAAPSPPAGRCPCTPLKGPVP